MKQLNNTHSGVREQKKVGNHWLIIFLVYCSTFYLMGNGKNPVEEETAFSKLLEREFPQINFEDGKQERIVFAPPLYIHPRSGIARIKYVGGSKKNTQYFLVVHE